jgi:hypothetical protein
VCRARRHHPTGTACKNHYDANGSDPNFAAVDATGPKVADVINGIHQRAPQAKVLIVGYPDGLPTNGTSCWPLVPISTGDIKYFNSLEQGLNQVEANIARQVLLTLGRADVARLHA